MALQTALDADPQRLDEQERKFVDDIRELGWFDTSVLADEAGSGFSYTTGFSVTAQAPEFVVFGLNRPVAHDIFWDLYRDIQEGVRHHVGMPTAGIFGNVPAYLFEVSPRFHDEFLGWTKWFYAGEVPRTLQLVWPDRNGAFPWQPGFEESFRNIQPDLSEKGWANEMAA